MYIERKTKNYVSSRSTVCSCRNRDNVAILARNRRDFAKSEMNLAWLIERYTLEAAILACHFNRNLSTRDRLMDRKWPG